MGKKNDEGAWETVSGSKSQAYTAKKRAEKSAAESGMRQDMVGGQKEFVEVVGAQLLNDGSKKAAREAAKATKGTDKFKQAAQDLLPQYDALEAAAINPASKFVAGGGKKKKDDVPEPVIPEKKGMTEEEKAAARKERKKEAGKEKKELAKKEAAANKVILATKLAEHIPKDLIASLQKLPIAYKGKIKDQLRIACEILDAYFVPEAILSENYKALSYEERFALPLCAQSDGRLAAVLNPIFDEASSDDPMLNVVLREHVAQAFGRLNGCSRPDDGKHYLGTKLFIQLLLRRCPGAYSTDVKAVEDLFQRESDSKEMTGTAAVNYAWLLAQVPSRGAADAVRSWGRIFLPRILASNGTKGSVTEAAYAVAPVLTQAGGIEYPEYKKDRQEWRQAEGSDPVTAEHLIAACRLVGPKQARITRLTRNTLAPFSILFTPSSPVKYFVRLAQLLIPHPDARDVILSLLVDAAVLDPHGMGCLFHWTDSFIMLIRETAMILEYMYKHQKELMTRLNGKEIEKLFDRLQQKADAVLRGELVPEGKKQAKAVVEQKDVERVLDLLRKVSGLTKAKPEGKSRSGGGQAAQQAAVSGGGKGAKAQQQTQQQKNPSPRAKPRKNKKGGGGMGFCSMLFFLVVLCAVVCIAVYVATPFLPPDVQKQVRRHFNTAAKLVEPVANWPPLKPHIDTLKKMLK